MKNAAYWMDTLGLRPHPEGGHYRETYRSPERVAALPPRFPGARSLGTAIYFLLDGDDFSALHRIKADEIWHFYAGSTVAIRGIAPDGSTRQWRLGTEDGALPQAVIPAGWWFGAALEDTAAWVLVGCTVAPGFDFADFELGNREDLLAAYPDHRELILALTRAD